MRFSIMIFGLCVLYGVSATSSEKDATSFWDMVPVVSQGKSLVQLICGDAEGAKKTQEKFLNEGLVTSQLRSVYFLATGEPKTAGNIQGKFFSNLEGVVDSLPVIGHVKGGIHLLAGDDKHGWNALKSSTSTTGAIVGGVFGGPLGAIGGHLLTDAVITGTDAVLNGNQSQPHGLIDYAINFKNLKPGEHFDVIAGLVLDAKAGKTAKKVKSESDFLNTGRIQGEKSAGYHELTPLIKSENLKNKRVVGMPLDLDSIAIKLKPDETDTDEEEIMQNNDHHNEHEYNIFKHQRFVNFLKNDLTYKDLQALSFLFPDVAQNDFANTGKYEFNFYLDQLDIDSLRNKLTYLSDTEKSLITKYDFRYIDNTPLYRSSFMCSLASILNLSADTIQRRFSERPELLDGTRPIECLSFLKQRKIINYDLSLKMNTIIELNSYLASYMETVGYHPTILHMIDGDRVNSVILKYKFVENNPNPVILLVDYKYPGIIKPNTPNPYRFRTYIDTDKYKKFYLTPIRIMK